MTHEARGDRSSGLDRRVRRLGSHQGLAADGRRRAPGGPARVRVDLAVRPLHDGPPPDRRDHVRVVHVARRPGRGHRARPPRSHRDLHRVPEPGPDGQDDLDDGHDQRRPDGPRDRRRLEAGRVAVVRLRLPRDERAAGEARRRPRGDHPDARRRPARARDLRGPIRDRARTRSTSPSRSSGRASR